MVFKSSCSALGGLCVFLITGLNSPAQGPAKKAVVAGPKKVAELVPNRSLPVALQQKQQNKNAQEFVAAGQVGNQGDNQNGQLGDEGNKQNGQTGDQGEKQNGQTGEQGEKQNGQVGDQGDKQNGQTGDQGDKQNGQSGDQGDKKVGRIVVPINQNLRLAGGQAAQPQVAAQKPVSRQNLVAAKK